MMRNRPILLSLLLSLPVILFLLHHYFYHDPGLRPTGFTVDENVLYMSYARQYADSDTMSLFYSNPFDGDPASPKIYFQPATLLLAAGIRMGLDPGLTFSLFGLLMAIACIYMGIRIIRMLVPTSGHPVLLSVLFTWGGGLTAIAGLVGTALLAQASYSSWLDGIFLADPANGWWGLNWGRNLFIPLEAFYHFLFLSCVYFILRKKWMSSLLVAGLLSISHPFTGIEYLLILLGWLFIEKIIKRNTDIPWWFVAGSAVLSLFHCWYYLIWLNQFPEHRQLFSQYSAGWTYPLLVALPAFALVIALVLLSVWKHKPFGRILSTSHQRLFVCWAVISFLLSKHEWFIKPMQPVHFTRGYTWAGLFLLSLPGLLWLIGYLKKLPARKWLLVLFVTFFLADNILWTINLLRKKDTVEWEGHLTKDTRDVLIYLETHASSTDLITGNARLVRYLANVYTPANSWVSHPYNTPGKNERIRKEELFFQTGTRPAEWKDRRILVVVDKRLAGKIPPGQRLFENASYVIVTP